MNNYSAMSFRGQNVLISCDRIYGSQLSYIKKVGYNIYGIKICETTDKTTISFEKDYISNNWGHVITPHNLLKDGKDSLRLKKAEHKIIRFVMSNEAPAILVKYYNKKIFMEDTNECI